MTKPVSTIRAVSLLVPMALFTVLAGCSDTNEHGRSLRITPVSTPGDSAAVPPSGSPIPNTSGPREFPLLVKTGQDFYPAASPAPTVTRLADDRLVIVVYGGVTKPAGTKVKHPTSGPRQSPAPAPAH